ncbi:diguanylate cyclase (GGDEF) domain-containing protein [Lentzea xinjiangensis]|uniref:Diguanylate cyclase (GGDEF) domain-containing protein n=1 Tax=Lentzea xinjiangensis TaxID=402600 RepID=A0A1H9P3Y0_9PSEU|nr:GGDEF domain-containing protein [Lentzea xinjiangensis]SER43004.1 diguanylate cyclase (GGDEF) domain-containing protein [Lentzea xinjiangensis]
MKRFWVVVGCVGTFMAVAISTALTAPRETGVAIDKVVQLAFAVAALVAYARLRDRWMTAAMTSLTIGLSAWIWGQQVMGVQLPSSTIAPLGFTLVPVLCLAAVVVKAQQRRAGDLLPNYRSRAVVVLDGLIVIGSLFVLTWVSALESLSRAWATEGAGFATVVAHPAAYLVLLVTIVVMSWTHQAVRQWPMLFVALAGIAQSSSGWVFAFYISQGITAIPAAADVGFMLCPAFFLLSALAPTSDVEPTPGRMRTADLLHLLVPYLPLAITGLFVGWNTATGGRLNPVEIYAGILVVCFVIVRQLLTMMDNIRLMDQLRVSREELRHEATHDPLTGVANRSLFQDRLERALAVRDRTRPLVLLFIDVDGFKAINDNNGHAEGDMVLRNVAARLKNNVRPEDTVARLGGDEFGVLVDGGDADEIGARLLSALAHPHEVRGRVHHVHASIGVAQRFSYDSAVTADDVLGDADAAMYAAKRLGKGKVVVHGSPLPEMT